MSPFWTVAILTIDPFKVIETRTNWKRICDFLLVFHCNYVLIFYRFRDVTTYCSKIPHFTPFLPITVSSEALAGGSPGTRGTPGTQSTKIGLKLENLLDLTGSRMMPPPGLPIQLWPPVTLTFNPEKFGSFHCPEDHLRQFATKSVHSSAKISSLQDLYKTSWTAGRLV